MLAVAGTVVDFGALFFDTAIRKSKVEDFQDRNGIVLRYSYGMDVSTLQYHKQGTHHQDTKQREAADIAHWFLHNPYAFGRYRLASWNCEHFATFCHTTSLDVHQLEKNFQAKKHEFQQFLRDSGTAVSHQVERFLGASSDENSGEEYNLSGDLFTYFLSG